MLKRQKVSEPEGSSHKAKHGSKIFSPFRTVGLVTNNVPFSVTALGQSFVITTVVGRSFQVYDASSLSLLFVSQPQTDAPIDVITSHFQYVFAAWGNKVGIFKRARLQNTVVLPDATKVLKITVFGENLCVLTKSKLYIYHWDAKANTAKLYTTLAVPVLVGDFVDFTHPPTYLNKLVVATEYTLLLYNIKTGKLVHTFEEVPNGIAMVVPSPTALDVVAVVSKNGDVNLFNIRKAKNLFTLTIGEPIVTASFRNDGSSVLGVGTAGGDLFFYDLNLKRRVHSVRNMHKEGGVVHMEFLAGQPLVVSAGGDNTLVELVFDPPLAQSNSAISSPPRILRQRGGHSRPPTSMIFTDAESHFILSGSLDESLWSFSLRKDSQSYKFSQREKSSRSKMNSAAGLGSFTAITDIAYQANKQSEWDNILTCHKNETIARTWSGKRGIVGAFQLPTIDGGIAKKVFITNCGNFGFVGSSKGGLAGYNLQSGMIRKRLPAAHKQEITGIAVDATNSIIMSSSLEGIVRFHDFGTLALIKEIDFEHAISELRFHSGSGLLAAILDDMSIVVIDIVTFKTIRQLWGHGNRITSFDFTPDGRWIISASLDGTIRTWDIPSGGAIDAVRVPTPVSVLRISPTSEWLATAHVNGVGIQLWTMKSQFHTISTRLVGEDEITDIIMPNAAGEGGVGLVEHAVGEQAEDEIDLEFEDYTPPTRLSEELETMSLQPRFKFNTLIHLDTIKERNKPKEAPKAPEKLPFFLTASTNGDAKAASEVAAGVATLSDYSGESKFTAMLREGQLEELAEHLAGLGPAAVDLELRSINVREPYSELIAFVDAMTRQLEVRTNFELVQAWMNMLLRIHGDVFAAGSDELREALEKWHEAQKAEASRIKSLAQYCSGVVSYLRRI